MAASRRLFDWQRIRFDWLGSSILFCYLATILASGGLVALGSGLVQLLLFVPGLAVLAAVRRSEDGWLPVASFGPTLGVALTTPLLLVAWASGARGPWLLAVAPAVASLVALPARRMRG